MPYAVEPGRVKARHRKVKVVLSVAEAIDLAKYIEPDRHPRDVGPDAAADGCGDDCGPRALFKLLKGLGYTIWPR